MNHELEKLIEAIVADGSVTDKDRRIINMTADRLGIDRAEADVWLDAALVRAAASSARSTVTPVSDATVENCSMCGAAIEPIMSNCMFCGASTRGRDPDSISDEKLIMKASEWIGKISDGTLVLEAPNASHLTGRGIKRMQKGEIGGIAARYLNVLHIRAQKNSAIASTVARLDADYARNLRSPTVIRKYSIGLVIAMIVMVISFTVSDRSHAKKINGAVATLSTLEVRIQDNIARRDFAIARTLVVQLDWPNADGFAARDQEWSNKYAEKRRAYLETIDRLEQESQLRQ